VTPVGKRTCDIAEKRHFIKGKLHEFFVLVWTKLNTSTQISNSFFFYCIMLQQQIWKHFAKSKRHFKQWRTLGFPRHGTNSVQALPPSPFVAAQNKRNTAIWCFTWNYLIPRTKFSCFCCWNFIDYFVKKLIWFKCATYFNLKNI